MKTENYTGILCVDKPAGFTSFDVIAKLRGILRMKRLGHAGTLDPMATGVLPVFVGYATKACHILPDESKTYLAGFQLGCVTDTQDCTGSVLETHDFSGISESDILEAIPQGEIMQIPPMYSAVSVNGKRLYELARQGIVVERQARPARVEIRSFPAFDAATGTGVLEIHCSKGTYVRTLLHDMGKSLSCGAVMTSLRRTEASGIGITSCHTLETIAAYARAERIPELLLPTEQLFSGLPAVRLNTRQTALYRNGVKLDLSQFSMEFSTGQPYAVYGVDGFLGTATADLEQHCLRVQRNLCEPLGANAAK